MDALGLTDLVEQELKLVLDERVVKHIRGLLVPPHAEERGWDYGELGQTYPCWILLDDRANGTGVGYSEFGFGPERPWGLLWMGGDESRRSMGMDSGWFATFMDAFFDSFAATSLPIWRVFSMNGGQPARALTDEMSWDAAWVAREAMRTSDPGSNYVVHHTIPYGAADGSNEDRS